MFKVNVLVFALGTNAGWYSPALPIINTVPSPLLDGPISQVTAGLIGGGGSFTALVGCLVFGLMANWIGYKRALQLASIPGLVSLTNYRFEDVHKYIVTFCEDFLAIYLIWQLCMAYWRFAGAVLSCRRWCLHLHSSIRGSDCFR